MKREPVDKPPPRVPCNKCGAGILPLTADYTGGFCMPCFSRVGHAAPNAKPLPTPVVEEKEGFINLISSSNMRRTKHVLKALEKHGVPFQCIPDQCLVPHQGGPRYIYMVRILIQKDDKIRASLLIHFHQPTNAIRNCKVEFKYVCPNDWDELEGTGKAATRFCQECRQNVFFCSSDMEAIAHARQGHCIAMAGEDGSARRFIRMGFLPQAFPPLSEEAQASLDAWSRDQAKTRALQSVTESSRFCENCGYPLSDEAMECGVCDTRAARKLRI